jgi:hypothetical protein
MAILTTESCRDRVGSSASVTPVGILWIVEMPQFVQTLDYFLTGHWATPSIARFVRRAISTIWSIESAVEPSAASSIPC